jgi:hypothetical protein
MDIKTMEPIYLKATTKAERLDPETYQAARSSGMVWLYLWKLENLDLPLDFNPIKLGIARHAYSTGQWGWLARITGCVRDVEKAFQLERGTLTAKVLALKLAAEEDIYNAERYVHFHATHNADNKVNVRLPKDLAATWRKVAGQSEFYDASERSMLGRFYNSLRSVNRKIGGDPIARLLEDAHIKARGKA